MGKTLDFISDKIGSAATSWNQYAGNPYANGTLAGIATTAADVSSIPSPYARMDLYSDAFKAVAAGTNDAVYRKCVSHCFDVFEMLFRHGKEAFKAANITVEHHFYEGNNPADVTQNAVYYEALRAYRANFGMQFFKGFYLIKQGTAILAATSHLTGFYCPANVPEVTIDGKTYFLSKETGVDHWRDITQRNADFQRFMYELLKALALNTQFASLSAYLNQVLAAQIVTWIADGMSFKKLYPRFNINGIGNANLTSLGLPLDTKNNLGSTVYVLCDRYDSCYMKYLFFPNKTNLNFNINTDEYQTQVMQRTNPADGTAYPWVSVNDFLADEMILLNSEINSEMYYGFTEAGFTNIIPPLKPAYFTYFTKNDLNDNPISISGKDGEYDVNLTLPVDKGSSLTLTRHYSSAPQGNDGRIVQPDFDIAIYPFIKTPLDDHGNKLDNFYRIMIYSKGLKTDEGNTNLYCVNANGFVDDNSLVTNINDGHSLRKRTTIDSSKPNFEGLNTYITYISLNSKYYERDMAGNMKLISQPCSFDFINLSLSDPNSGDNVANVFLVPKLKQTAVAANRAIVSVDLGTTNTYISYGDSALPVGTDAYSYDTMNTYWADREMGRLIKSDATIMDKKVKYDKDTSAHQWCEFIPSYFNENDGFHFPISTVLNRTSTTIDEISNFKTSNSEPLNSLFDINIPFSIFENGTRNYKETDIDHIESNFKWFDPLHHPEKKNEYILFIDQLCMMLRTKLILQNFDPRLTTLVWTYPLAFEQQFKICIAQQWEDIYKKYFNDVVPVPPAAGINILAVSESRTPLLHSSGLVSAVGTKLGIDIGGGSTDVLAYKGEIIHGDIVNKVTLASSFKFAGNNLFAANGTVINQNNYWYKLLNSANLLSNAKSTTNNIVNKKVATGGTLKNIADIMNYVFSVNAGNLWQALSTQKVGLLVTLHNVALLYQIADLCKAENLYPTHINFSGNGSLLLLLHRKAMADTVIRLKQLVNDVFKYVYGDSYRTIEDTNIEIADKPKEATAKGAIEGYQELQNLAGVMPGIGLAQTYRVTDDINSYKVRVGDKDYTSFDPNGNVQLPKKAKLSNEIEQKVKAQVNDFLNFYYQLVGNNEIFGGPYNVDGLKQIIINKKSIDSGYDNALAMMDGDYVNDSLFLGIISQIITDFVRNFNLLNYECDN